MNVSRGAKLFVKTTCRSAFWYIWVGSLSFRLVERTIRSFRSHTMIPISWYSVHVSWSATYTVRPIVSTRLFYMMLTGPILLQGELTWEQYLTPSSSGPDGVFPRECATLGLHCWGYLYFRAGWCQFTPIFSDRSTVLRETSAFLVSNGEQIFLLDLYSDCTAIILLCRILGLLSFLAVLIFSRLKSRQYSWI